MEKTYTRTLNITKTRLTVHIYQAGSDLAILAEGGKSHIGSVVLTLPRRSLKGDGSLSCTSSVLNVPGHLDEQLLRILAEAACSKYGVTVCAAGGFHVDGITPEGIREVLSAASSIAQEL